MAVLINGKPLVKEKKLNGKIATVVEQYSSGERTKNFTVKCATANNGYIYQCDCGTWIVCKGWIHHCKKRTYYVIPDGLYIEYKQTEDNVLYNVRLIKDDRVYSLGVYDSYIKAMLVYRRAKTKYHMRDDECEQRI